MTMDFSKLHGRPKNYTIGKDLPEDERVVVALHPLSIDKLHLADFSEKLTPEEQLAKVKVLLAEMLRTTEEEIGLWDAGYFEELSNAAMQRLNVTDEKQTKIRKMLEEKRVKEDASAQQTGQA